MSTVWNWPYPLPDGSDLTERLKQAEQTIRQMSDRIGYMERQLEEIKARSPIHVEYHFDQLKVNELKGTLNVGLSPQGVQGIDSFETPAADSWKPVTGPVTGLAVPPIGQLQQQMADYMDREAPAVLAALEKENEVSLGENLRMQVVSDVKNQLNERVHYYANTAPFPAAGTEENRRQWRLAVIDKSTRDVKAAFTAYLAARKSASGYGREESS